MRILGVLLGSLLWLVAGIVGLLGIVLSVTIILAPIGIPLLMLARRLFQMATRLAMPRAVRHPAKEMGKKTPDAVKPGRAGRKARNKMTKKAGKKAGKAGKTVRKQRKKVPV